MLTETKRTDLFCEYYAKWITVYTQKTYLHIIQELENKDIDLVMRSLSGLS